MLNKHLKLFLLSLLFSNFICAEPTALDREVETGDRELQVPDVIWQLWAFKHACQAATSTNASPLHIAAQFGDHDAVVKYLLANPAGIHDKNSNGQTPLDIALAFGHTHLEVILREGLGG